MNAHTFPFHGAELAALPSGALWWPSERLLCVSDLHLGKSERMARRNGGFLPPYETRDTLNRLNSELTALAPAIVICLGDSFDDLETRQNLEESALSWIAGMQAGRRWIWIEGNHDPGPVELGGEHHARFRHKRLTFRHIAQPDEQAEISGHYHPKARLSARGTAITRPAFLVDEHRIVMPAFGTYTGGLHCHSDPLASLMQPGARAILTGKTATAIPMPGVPQPRLKAR